MPAHTHLTGYLPRTSGLPSRYGTASGVRHANWTDTTRTTPKQKARVMFFYRSSVAQETEKKASLASVSNSMTQKRPQQPTVSRLFSAAGFELRKCERRAEARSADNGPTPAVLRSALVDVGDASVPQYARNCDKICPAT